MDLTYSAEDEEFRQQARGWLRANVPAVPLPSGDTRAGFAEHVQWERHLHRAGWSVVSWPKEYGGRDADLWQWLIFEEEYYHAGGPQRVTQNGIFLLAPTLFRFGSQEQRDRILPRMAAAEDLWCQAWSEPGAGSDLAALTSRATRADLVVGSDPATGSEPATTLGGTAVRGGGAGGWVLNGHKTWSTRGAFCTHAFGLFRTVPQPQASSAPQSSAAPLSFGAPRSSVAAPPSGAGRAGHRGLTYFLVPLDAPGVTVHGFSRLDGDEGFADLYFRDVFVPDRDVLGEVHHGWRVAMATTGSERGLTLRSPGRFRATFDRLRELARSRPGGLDPRLADRLVSCWLDVEAYARYTEQTVTRIVDGAEVGAESSLNKLHWSELDVRLHELALELLGPRAQLDGPWTRGHLFSLAGPIYAGSNEIQRDIAAERLLGLPRGR
jgi:alkylation response protein AidB-like acyl-CoA dehydrogenase